MLPKSFSIAFLNVYTFAHTPVKMFRKRGAMKRTISLNLKCLQKSKNYRNVEVEVYSVNELRTVSAKGNQESKVLDVAILINNHKAQLTGWNIISEFLYYMLKGQEVNILISQRLIYLG